MNSRLCQERTPFLRSLIPTVLLRERSVGQRSCPGRGGPGREVLEVNGGSSGPVGRWENGGDGDSRQKVSNPD